MIDKDQNTYFIGFIGVDSTFRPVRAKTLSDAKNKFADYNCVTRSDMIVASRNIGEMHKRSSEMIE